MGTSMPLLREQVQKEELMGHDMGIVDLSLSHGFREPVPTSDMHTVAAGNRQVRPGIHRPSGEMLWHQNPLLALCSMWVLCT